MTQHSKQEQRARTLPSSSRAEEETTCGFGQRDIGSNGFFVVKISNGKKRKRSPALSSRSRAGRAPRAAEAPPLWIAWRKPRRKAQRGKRGEKTKREKKVWRQSSCSLFSFETFSFSAAIASSVFFLGQPRRLPSLLPLLYARALA